MKALVLARMLIRIIGGRWIELREDPHQDPGEPGDLDALSVYEAEGVDPASKEFDVYYEVP